MSLRGALRGWFAWAGAILAAGTGTTLRAAGQTDYQQTLPLIDVMFVLSLAGALVTFGILVWALVKFRDPATKGRRYG
ncbi:MAG TPA: hypothetical protein VEY07_00300 [Thermoplasmata archaeon]|nr:hypothetical protein [Thermoplasmata archaeon]